MESPKKLSKPPPSVGLPGAQSPKRARIKNGEWRDAIVMKTVKNSPGAEPFAENETLNKWDANLLWVR